MKKYKLIANPAAGRGKASLIAPRVRDLFRARDCFFDLEFTRGPKDATRIARAACRDYDVIVAVGGDGTINEIIPAMIETSRPLGIIPLGSGNDFVKSLNIPCNPARAVELILKERTKVIDVGKINDRYFVNAVGIGFDAAVNRESYKINHHKHGLLLYLYALVRTLGRYEPVPLILQVNSETMDEKFFLVTAGNGTTVGGGFRLTPDARTDDGLLDITIIKPISIPALLYHLPKVFLGTISRAERYARTVRTSRLLVKTRGPAPIHIDGEILITETDGNQFEIEIIPKALAVIGNF